MDIEKTSLFKVKKTNIDEIREKLSDVYDALEERGYNPTNQLVGYLISGDLGYISSHKDARKKIQSLDRTKIIEVLLEEFQNNKQ